MFKVKKVFTEEQTKELPDMCSIRDVADALEVHYTFVHKAVVNGALKATVKHRAKSDIYLIAREDVLEWLRAEKREKV